MWDTLCNYPDYSCLRMDPTEAGDYRICFDNSFSRLVEKMVFVEVIVGSQEEADEGWAHLMEPENALGYKLDDIKVCHLSKNLAMKYPGCVVLIVNTDTKLHSGLR